MRWVAWISLFLTVWLAKGQSVYPLIDPSMVWIAPTDSSLRNMAGAYSWLEAGSGSVPSALVNRFLRAGRIDTDLKNTALDRLNEQNNAGLQWRQGVFIRGGQPNRGWWLRGENNTTLGITFSRDLYRLVMYGNASFAGNTAILSGSIMQDNHNLLELGITRSRTVGNGKLSVAPSIALKQGYSAQTGELDGTLYTAPDGSYLDMDVAGHWFRTDSNNAQPYTFRGFGVNAGLWVQYEAGKWQVGGRYFLQLPIGWKAFSPNFSGDIQRRWSGWNISELFNGGVGQPVAIDSLVAYLDTFTTAPVQSTQHIGNLFVSRMAGNWGITLGAQLTTEDWKNNQYYLQVNHQLGKRPLFLAGHLSYGGWSTINAGLHVRGNIVPQLYMMAGTQHVLSVVLPFEVPGTSYFVLLAWQW